MMIYLDHNATTPVLPEVLEAMMPYFTSCGTDISAALSAVKQATATLRA